MIICDKCKGENFRKHGTRLTIKGTYQLWQCIKCGHTQKGQMLKPNNTYRNNITNEITKIQITDKSTAIKYVKAFLTTYLFEHNKTTITPSDYMEIQEEISKKVEIKDPKNVWSLGGSIIDIAINEIMEENDSRKGEK